MTPDRERELWRQLERDLEANSHKSFRRRQSKKTLEEEREQTRKRVAKWRANHGFSTGSFSDRL